MPSATVTIDEVRAAIEYYRGQGINDPGVQRLQRQIGHGSPARITKLKHQVMADLRAEIVARSTLADHPMPDPISELAAKLWADMNQAFEAYEKDLEQAAYEKAAELESTLETLRREHQALLETVRGLEAQVGELQEKLETSETARTALESDLERAEAGRETEAQKVLEAQQRIVANDREYALKVRELEDQIAQERERQSEMAEQHASARKDWQAALKQQESQVEDLRSVITGQKEAFDRREAEFSAERQASARRIETLERERAGLVEEIESLEGEVSASEHDLQQDREARYRAEAQVKELDAKLEAVRAQLTAERERSADLSKSLDRLSAERKMETDRMAELINELVSNKGTPNET